MAANVRFYRLDSLPEFVQNTHQGLFVYLNIDTTDGQGNVIRPKGLWFGGSTQWELLTNVQGITLQDVMSWMDNENADYPFTGEAEIFGKAPLTDAGKTGTKYTIFYPVLDSTGLRASSIEDSEDSDAHEFTVGDGALKISGRGATVENEIPQATESDVVHSANDVLDSTLTLDNSLVWTPSGSAALYGGTIGVRTKSTVTGRNPIATMDDLAGLNGAMHLVGTLANTNEWPDQQGSNWITSGTPTGSQKLIKAGDTFIVTTQHDGPDGITYEVGDTVFYYESNGSLVYKVVNQNITTGKADGQHAAVDMPNGSLVEGKLVVATDSGIATTSNGISDFVTDVTSTQEITNNTEANETTYKVTTIVDRVDEGSDSNITTAPHEITFKSNNKSLTIVGDESTDNKINFDLVWLTTELV